MAIPLQSSDKLEPDSRVSLNDKFAAQDTSIAAKLDKSGGTMTGGINMNSNTITNLPAPTVSSEPARKADVDTKVAKAGDAMSGALAMGSNKITGLAAATANGDAVRYEQVPNIDVKEYVVLMSQSGTGNPSVTVIRNTLGGTPTVARYAVGRYSITLTGVFVAGKTTIVAQASSACVLSPSGAFDQVHAMPSTGTDQLPSNNVCLLATATASGLADGVLSTTTIIIRVYP